MRALKLTLLISVTLATGWMAANIYRGAHTVRGLMDRGRGGF